MMSLATIQEQNREAAEKAAAEGLRPFVYSEPDEVSDDRFPFPFLGDHRPDGWKLVDTHFVDSSGFGAPGEPAYTAEQFARVIRAVLADAETTVGWAVIEAGQFQVYVGEFHRV